MQFIASLAKVSFAILGERRTMRHPVDVSRHTANGRARLAVISARRPWVGRVGRQ